MPSASADAVPVDPAVPSASADAVPVDPAVPGAPARAGAVGQDAAPRAPSAGVASATRLGIFERGGRFGALSYHDFRLAFFGQSISAIGSWMQLVTLGWLVYDLTGSSFFLGMVGLARAIPALLFTLVGGAAADRYNRRVIVAAANTTVTLCCFTLGTLCLTGAVSVWHVIVIAFITGTAFAFEVPSRQALISSIMEPRDVVGGLGLMSVAFNTAQVIGPAVAAVLIELIGEGPVFLANGFGYAAVMLAAVLMRTPGRPASRGGGSILANILDGLRYIRRTPELSALVVSMALVSLVARPFTQLTPAFARDVFDAGAAGLGALNSAAGAGALLGAIVSAALGAFRGRGLVLLVSAAGFGAMLIAFGLSTSLTLSVGIAGAIGLLSAYSGINSNTMLQTHADPRMRGRVISLHGLTMMGVVPLGVMLEGALGSLIGVPVVVTIAGFVAVVVSLVAIAVSPRLRALD